MKKMCAGVLFVVVGVAVGLFAKADAFAAESLKMVLDWKLKGTHAPYFVADKKGYYKSEGIDISISQGQGSVNSVKFVGSGQFHFAFADYATMAKGVTKGIPVRAVFAIQQQSPMALIALPKSGVKKLEDIKGKKVAVSSGDSTSQILPGLLAKNNIPMNAITLLTTAPAGKVAALMEGKVDLMTGYADNQLQIVKAAAAKQGIQPVAIRFSDYGVNLLANGVVAQEDLVQKKPDLVRAYLRATKKGWEDAQKDEKGAMDIVIVRFPEAKKRKQVLANMLTEVLGMLHSERTKGKPLGWMAKEDWADTVDLLKKYGGVKGDVKIDRLYTNNLLPN